MSDPAEDHALPALRLAVDNPLASLHRQMPVSLQLLLDEKLSAQVGALATIMAGDTVFTPSHLRGKPQACHTVISLSLQWVLDPHFVARCTYMTPGGQIGFEGKLVQAILEKSNRFIGAPAFEYTGDWTRVTGRFTKRTSQKGNEFVVPAWDSRDAEGCGVTIRWKVRGEDEPRVWPAEGMPFFLTQCYPLNSPLWATDPRSQIRYLAIRRFADQAAPGILAGMPFDPDDLLDASERARDVTNESPPPRPTRESVAAQTAPAPEPEPEPEPEPPYAVTSYTGDTQGFDDPKAACEDWYRSLEWADKEYGLKGLEAVWESNSELYAALDANLFSDLNAVIRQVYQKRHEAAVARERMAQATEAPPEPPGEAEAPPAATVAPEPEQAPPAPPAAAAEAASPAPADDGEIPFPDDGRRIVPPDPPAPDGLGFQTSVGGLSPGRPRPRDPIWQTGALAFEPPSIRGRVDWVGYANRLRRLIPEARDQGELEALMKAHADTLTQLSTAAPPAYSRIAELAGQRQREFEATC